MMYKTNALRYIDKCLRYLNISGNVKDAKEFYYAKVKKH